MTQAILSTKYQLVVPLEIRKQLGLHSGQKMLFLVKDGVITLIPDRPLHSLKGIAKGLRAGPVREKKERDL